MGTTSIVSEIFFSIFQTGIKRGGEVRGGDKGGEGEREKR